MKTTIKLGGVEALTVQADGSSVSLAFTVGAIPVAKKVFSLATVGAVLAAIEGAAQEAERFQMALNHAAGLQ
jgi:hypothetical protein